MESKEMESKEIVTRAIEFRKPPRLPFFLGGLFDKIEKLVPGIPNDLCDCFELDRQKAGWFFDNAAQDDWGCGWATTEKENMGQVIYNPLAVWSNLNSFIPPNPKDNFYYERIGDIINKACGRYVMVTSHFNLFERLYMLHGFEQTLMDLYTCPEKCEKIIDMILDFKLEMFNQLYRRFKDNIHGLWLTDDWGTQLNTFISKDMFKAIFLHRYKILADAIHDYGWHFHLHSCGRINDFIPFFIEAGIDVLNLQQPRTYGIEEIGRKFAGKICFQTTADIQSTLPKNDMQLVKKEVKELIENWSTPEGGFIVFNYGHSCAIGVKEEVERTMFNSFYELANFWRTHSWQKTHNEV